MSKKEKDWKSKAKNPPAGKEGPGAMLIGKAKNETAATKEAEKGDDKNHASIDANMSTSTDESTEKSKVTFVREKIKVKKGKLKYTDTHTAVSTYIRNDLLIKLDRIAPHVDGGKAGIINRALEDHLQLYEEED